MKDSNGKFIPQYMNEAGTGFEALKGRDGASFVQLTGSKPKEPFSGTSTITKTFTQSMNGFGISNDDTSISLTFTLNGDTWTIKAGETWEYSTDPFTQVTITTNVAFRAWGLK